MTNNRYKILLVEDEANIRTVMTAMLEAADYQVILAETCSLALNLFSSYQPDVVILDCIFWRRYGKHPSLPLSCFPPEPMTRIRCRPWMQGRMIM